MKSDPKKRKFAFLLELIIYYWTLSLSAVNKNLDLISLGFSIPKFKTQLIKYHFSLILKIAWLIFL